MDEGKMLNIDGAVALLGYKKSYLYKLTSKKMVPHYRPNGGKIFFDKTELIGFMRRNKALAVYEQVEHAEQILNGSSRRRNMG
jgi:excisionase family DNA binding protein